MNILSFIGEIFKPAAKLIDDLHTSDEEKLTLKINLLLYKIKCTVKLLIMKQNF